MGRRYCTRAGRRRTVVEHADRNHIARERRDTILDVPGAYAFGVFDGRLVYARPDGPIMSVPIDVRRRRILGEPIVLMAGVSMGLEGHRSPRCRTTEHCCTRPVVARNARACGPPGGAKAWQRAADQYQQPRFSPNGRQIAVSVFDLVSASGDIWVIDRDGTTKSRLPARRHLRQRSAPEWTPDGKRLLLVVATRTPTFGSGRLASQPADGSAPAEMVGGVDNVANSRGGYTLSRDGRTLVSSTGRNNAMDIWYRSLVGADTMSKPLLTSSAGEFAPALSPDGKWLAYVSDETGKEEVYVRAFPGPPSKWPVSLDGGSEPRWSSDGRHIYYRSEARKLIEAAVTTSPTFAVSARAVLFDDPYVKTPRHSAQYDVSPDGSGFVMIRRGETESKVLGIVNFRTVLARARER